ncbi:SDR family NAD(P)-dependent oxidoreductase [Kribbella sp. GL6]|uniref:SDR family NAD(P)-dependent oxidoreductase n=1 Tax=Kribbella sp. GL6 TaxID=3419765 RepID=UPI003CFC8390
MSKVWFVTGSSRGLGRAFVEAALARGDKVAATARTDLKELSAKYGDAVLPLVLDVTDKSSVFAAVEQAQAHFGRLDVIVNNAGYGLSGAVEELDESQLRDQLETNFFGPLWVVQATLPYLRDQGDGRIIQVSSVAGLLGLPLGGAYCASKWALEGLSEVLAQEVAGFGVKVTILEPGGYATEGVTGGVQSAGIPLYDNLRAALTAYVAAADFGDPDAAGRAILELADTPNPPLRIFFGTQGYPMAQQAYADRLKTWADWQDLSVRAM